MAAPKTCEHCGVTTFVKAKFAQAQGWTVKFIHGECEAWTCGRCNAQNEARV